MISLTLDNPQLAQTYDEISDSQFDSGRRLISLLDVTSGSSVLDIGCGTGRIGFHVAEVLGATGTLVGLDPLADRISVARQKNLYPNVEFRVGSAENLSGLASDSIDVVYLSAVFHWVEQKATALREINRVLKVGGRIGLTTNAKELALSTTLAEVTAKVFARDPYRAHVRPDDFAPLRFGVTSTQLIELFVEAGLKLQSLQVQSIQRSFKNGRTVVDFAESSMFGNYTGKLPESLRAQARAELALEFDQLQEANGISALLYTVFAVARKVAVTRTTNHAQSVMH